MTLQQLRYIIKIVECGSISEAAKQLFIAQPSLSNAVKELETELGIDIFNRTTKGINLSVDGAEFLSYARQVVEQTELLEERYKGKSPSKRLFSVSTQHYAFAVNAFVTLLLENSSEEYDFTLRETRTYDIIEDVSNLRSEIGILYFTDFNKAVIGNLLREKRLIFSPLFDVKAHVFISSKNPLAEKEYLTLEDLEEYPRLSFEQGEYNSFYFSEEILSTTYHKKSIHVSDRATLFNLLIGLDGYTLCTGILNQDLNGDNIVSIPLKTNEIMQIGYIVKKNILLSQTAQKYIEKLKALIQIDGFELLGK